MFPPCLNDSVCIADVCKSVPGSMDMYSVQWALLNSASKYAEKFQLNRMPNYPRVELSGAHSMRLLCTTFTRCQVNIQCIMGIMYVKTGA